MKNFKLGTLLTLFALALFIFSCGSGGDHGHSHDKDGGHSETTTQTDENAEVDLTSKEYASAFICPMHCKGSGSDAASKCPVCGMDYVANENYKSDTEGHDHDNHEGHDHDDHEGHNH